MKNFLIELCVFPNAYNPLNLYYDNNRAIVQAKEPRNHQKNKHVLQNSILYESSSDGLKLIYAKYTRI